MTRLSEHIENNYVNNNNVNDIEVLFHLVYIYFCSLVFSIIGIFLFQPDTNGLPFRGGLI